MSIKILIIINNHVICEGLRLLLDEDGFDVTTALSPKVTSFSPDIVLFDSQQNASEIMDTNPEAKLLFLDTGLKERDLICLLFCYHITGIIAPETNVEMFKKALKVVCDGQIWIDQKHIKSLLLSGGGLSDNNQISEMSSQDKVIVQLITQGNKNKEIAYKMCLSEHTIKAHISRIYKKLNVQNRSQLVCLAMESRLDSHEEPS
ncbi:response regulator transcription factor [Vibrio hangzhouensis]|uniref:Regulatory protein, luxR family n=1 Tax=Vibrio hangzhouensis TaxID=462991 RepID=A0A1H5S2M3_9VIBR|nr:response regulator transcription factor [Vibrio hangzhouensis]SEF44604.1 regulatory protein, luxR family [Vibrio hangzhouensis]